VVRGKKKKNLLDAERSEIEPRGKDRGGASFGAEKKRPTCTTLPDDSPACTKKKGKEVKERYPASNPPKEKRRVIFNLNKNRKGAISRSTEEGERERGRKRTLISSPKTRGAFWGKKKEKTFRHALKRQEKGAPVLHQGTSKKTRGPRREEGKKGRRKRRGEGPGTGTVRGVFRRKPHHERSALGTGGRPHQA